LQLDNVDCQILDTLQKDGRIKNKDLAVQVGLSASACHERVRRLESAGIVRGYRALVDASALGARFDAWIDVEVREHTGRDVDDFLARLHTAEQVLSAHRVAGPQDFMLHVLARSQTAWSAFMREARDAGLDVVVKHMSVVTDCVKVRQPFRPNRSTSTGPEPI
jgi:Lrp/AsnC family leucine-responsive transcriptional regulator